MKIKNTGILYVVATPIGNLQDITYRAVEILNTVQLIAAEDTRHTKYLLKKFNINTPTTSLHQYNENLKTQKIISLLNTISIALVSNAGTPTINDPGYQLIKKCHQKNITVVPIPGPCAFITALSASGIPSDQFYYKGFFPKKNIIHIKTLKEIKENTKTIIFYESCHRILKSMQNIVHILGANRTIVFAKEITKKWETIKYGKSSDILLWLKEDLKRMKGEIIIIIKGIKKKKENISLNIQNTLLILQKKLSIKQAIVCTAKIHNISKNLLYKYYTQNILHDKK
ncbi:16S rRNA (cytidine(1402)-2'-O)-methyltransferase [Buchnera aphidicola]|uniref:16S rRNA (cytidine(1402)-2'-O)-methyltransferase n=1 Tax=Buchnera aphidicola TaxID=9 RepID=UPI003464248C